ncbi:MAG: hypothetical protein RLZZ450_3585 [Pseudomonadota bacterium]|jgi:hypothetical protein
MLRIETLCLGLATSLCVLACGDDSSASRGDSGQSATASDASAQGTGIDASTSPDATLGLDGALPGTTPHGDAASQPDSGADAARVGANLSCEQLTLAASTALRGALEVNRGCAVDSDCKEVWLSTSCYDGCSSIASAAQAQKLESAIGEQNSTSCAAFKARGCQYIAHPCDPPGGAVCIVGECREYRGSLPVTQPDGGVGVSPVRLDNPASPATADLKTGQRLELTLRTVGGGGYAEPTVSSVALRFVESFLPRLQNPGGPTKVFVFEAASPGTVQVSIPHSARPDPFKLTVNIR